MSIRSIADLNDAFRSGQPDVPGKVLMTQGISALPQNEIQAIFAKVQQFDEFTPDNDPYGEHDFGSLFHNEEKIFFKIDYYDPTLTFLSEDAADITKTVRVMTVMLASEY